jgi:hypothetical protein
MLDIRLEMMQGDRRMETGDGSLELFGLKRM